MDRARSIAAGSSRSRRSCCSRSFRSEMKGIASRENPSYKAMAKLIASAAERRKTGMSVLDGAHLLAAFLDAGGKPGEIMVSEAGLADAEIAGLLRRSG